jgi:hypothetical protein
MHSMVKYQAFHSTMVETTLHMVDFSYGACSVLDSLRFYELNRCFSVINPKFSLIRIVSFFGKALSLMRS